MVHEATGAARRTRELVLSFLKKTTAARTRSKLAELHISSLGGLVARLAAGAVVAASATFDGNTPPGVIDYALPAVTALCLLGLRAVTLDVAEARAASSEPFVIEYEHLPGSVGDERWRQEAVESTVRLSENGRGGRSCRIRAAGAYFGKACADDEPALLPPPSGWLAKIRIFFPLPVYAGLDELPCID